MNEQRILAATTKELAPLSFPKVAPEKMVRDYLHSKRSDELVKTNPVWDIPRMEPTAELVTHRKNWYDVETRLNEKRQKAAGIRKEMDEQWKDLETKELLLRENFIKFNKFVKENQEKRERAERKMIEEKALIQKREEDLMKLQEQHEHMTNVRNQMERNIKNHKLYEDYLTWITKKFPIFKTVEDIIDRYEALQEARKELCERQEADLNALEAARNKMLKLTEEKTLVIMGLTNVVAELQSRYETAKTKALQWESVVAKIKDTALRKMAQIYEVRQSVWNVYLQMCKRKEIEPELHRDDVENQLLFIKSTLLELKRITKATRRATRNRSVGSSRGSRFR